VPPVGKAVVRITANFESNLSAIEAFWRDRQAPGAFDQALDAVERVVSMLERHPRVGWNFLARTAHSIDVRDRLAALHEQPAAIEVRELVTGDYVMLYLFNANARKPVVDLLSIRHHRELSFDFEAFWQANRGPVPPRSR
jgi:plasmid stabilization system protein ParE